MAAPATLVDASCARSLRWWSGAALEAAATRLRRALEPWAAGWGLALCDVQACNMDAASPPGVPAHRHALAAGAAWLASADGSADGGLAVLLFGSAPAGARVESVLSDELAARAWQDLLEALTASLPAGGPALPAGQADRTWSGAVQLDFAVQGTDATARFSLRLHPVPAAAWCEGPSPAATAAAVEPRPPLVAAPEVVSRRPVRLSVQLAEVELDLGTLQSLAVGDVIRLPHRLDEPARVGVDLGDAPSRTPLGRANLAQRDGRVAAELVPGPLAR